MWRGCAIVLDAALLEDAGARDFACVNLKCCNNSIHTYCMLQKRNPILSGNYVPPMRMRTQCHRGAQNFLWERVDIWPRITLFCKPWDPARFESIATVVL